MAINTTAYAVVDGKDVLLLATVMPTKRGAMVNYLVSDVGVMVFNGATDDMILNQFVRHASERRARLVTVGVQVLGDA